MWAIVAVLVMWRSARFPLTKYSLLLWIREEDTVAALTENPALKRRIKSQHGHDHGHWAVVPTTNVGPVRPGQRSANPTANQLKAVNRGAVFVGTFRGEPYQGDAWQSSHHQEYVTRHSCPSCSFKWKVQAVGMIKGSQCEEGFFSVNVAKSSLPAGSMQVFDHNTRSWISSFYKQIKFLSMGIYEKS